MRQLRLLVGLYRLPRVLEYSGVSSQPVVTQLAVLAGCQFATLCLQMVLLCPLDTVQAAFAPCTRQEVKLGVVVDDFGLHK
eukprot:2682039-Pyramimonas_sp.AAC.1